MCLLALALAGASACGRGEEPPSTSMTTTTAGEIERQRVEEQKQLAQQERQRALQEQQRQLQEQQRQLQEQQQAQLGEVPSVQYQQHEKLRKAEEAKKAEEARKAAKAKQPAKPGAVTEQQAAKKKVPQTKTETPGEEEEIVIGETTITGAEVEVPPTTLPTPPGAEQPTTPPGAMPPVPGAAGAEPYVNRSTVLGDGTSGSYTDGQGTYGGRATWGTGGGLPAYPPTPR